MLSFVAEHGEKSLMVGLGIEAWQTLVMSCVTLLLVDQVETSCTQLDLATVLVGWFPPPQKTGQNYWILDGHVHHRGPAGPQRGSWGSVFFELLRTYRVKSEGHPASRTSWSEF